MATFPDTPITLYHHPKSGHCHKVLLFMHLLALPFTTREPDLMAGEHKLAPFLTLNGFGQIPVIEDGSLIISDSNAIVVYLAETYSPEPSLWLGRNPAEKAFIQRWFSVAAGELAKGPAAARLECVFGAEINVEAVLATSAALLNTMEKHLSQQSSTYLVANRLTAADIAMYSYIAHAPEGGISLASYPHIQNWLGNIEREDRFIAMPATVLPAVRL
ncbi:glutathione S-transferase family protein [Aestuariibacter sp. A3R04]|uniref:glutathione S-transferase family protein n=1 Tax=Aestuariibacter sp. A3R04 TaxID=2841571 RepID=UPI001C0A32DE|nr:glutathione S-transferase [Aestuariibacter sp. A3R04]MBU3022531.1 glutathione S-transferase [Aestuariibacter sp. A3R04]